MAISVDIVGDTAKHVHSESHGAHCFIVASRVTDADCAAAWVAHRLAEMPSDSLRTQAAIERFFYDLDVELCTREDTCRQRVSMALAVVLDAEAAVCTLAVCGADVHMSVGLPGNCIDGCNLSHLSRRSRGLADLQYKVLDPETRQLRLDECLKVPIPVVVTLSNWPRLIFSSTALRSAWQVNRKPAPCDHEVIGKWADEGGARQLWKMAFMQQVCRRFAEQPTVMLLRRGEGPKLLPLPAMLGAVGSWADQRGQRTMEARLIEDRTAHVYGVMDGHCGEEVVNAACAELPALLAECNTPEQVVAVFEKWDETPRLDWISGTTACLALIRGDKVLIANCGDSRATLLDADGNVLFQTVDHGTSNTLERQRLARVPGVSIAGVGGYVGKFLGVRENKSVQIAMTRALGDWALKPLDRKVMLATPDVTVLDRPAAGCKLLIYTDGIYNGMSASKSLASIMATAPSMAADPDMVARHLLCELDSPWVDGDNESIVVLSFV